MQRKMDDGLISTALGCPKGFLLGYGPLFLNKKNPVIGFDKIWTLMSNIYFDTKHAVTEILKRKDVALPTDALVLIAKEG